MHIDHLHGGKFFQNASRCEARGERVQASSQRDVQTVGKESDEDMRLDPILALMEDRPQCEITFKSLERFLDFDERLIEFPQPRRIAVGEVRQPRFAAFAPTRLGELLAIEPVAEATI